MNIISDRYYCLGLGASSKVSGEGAVERLWEALGEHDIQFSHIATLDKFADSIWLSYLKNRFSVPILLFPAISLAKYQTQIVTPSNKVFCQTGYYGIAEALALAVFDGKARLTVPKTICHGFTYAIACTDLT